MPVAEFSILLFTFMTLTDILVQTDTLIDKSDKSSSMTVETFLLIINLINLDQFKFMKKVYRTEEHIITVALITTK